MIFGNLSWINTIQARKDTNECSQSWLSSVLYRTTVNTTMSSGLMILVLSSPNISSGFVFSKEDEGIRNVTPNCEIPAFGLCKSIPSLVYKVCLVPTDKQTNQKDDEKAVRSLYISSHNIHCQQKQLTHSSILAHDRGTTGDPSGPCRSNTQ